PFPTRRSSDLIEIKISRKKRKNPQCSYGKQANQNLLNEQVCSLPAEASGFFYHFFLKRLFKRSLTMPIHVVFACNNEFFRGRCNRIGIHSMVRMDEEESAFFANFSVRKIENFMQRKFVKCCHDFFFMQIKRPFFFPFTLADARHFSDHFNIRLFSDNFHTASGFLHAFYFCSVHAM